MGFYQEHPKFYIAVDCIIFGFEKEELKILLIKRNMEPCKGQWSLMGGFLQKGENLDKAASRILEELTGLKDVYMEQSYTYSEVERDTAARVLSTAYFALIQIDEFKKDTIQNKNAKWWNVNNLPLLVFDHNNMIVKALHILQRKSKVAPIGFELLPEKFTIPQLQSLYEAILQKSLDKRNFRKKILKSNVLDQLEEKDKKNSKKGAYFFQFNRNKYQEVNGAFDFDV